MIDLPELALRKNLVFHWVYKNEEREVIALVVRYQNTDGTAKKRYHQYRIDKDGQWVEGAPTPLPLYGIDTLSKSHTTQKVYIFEGERCTTAAHHMKLAAITSMMGSNQAQYADWSLLAKYRHIKEFVLIPDNDVPGCKYMETVWKEIQKACPLAKISVCQLPGQNKGDDLIDWIQSRLLCLSEWDGFGIIKEPYSENLRKDFEEYVHQNFQEANCYFEREVGAEIVFEKDPESIKDVLSAVLPCPMETLPENVVNWIQGLALQMQISQDYLVAPLFVYLGSLIGRKRGLLMRPDTEWKEYPNLWGMLVGRTSMMKSPAMEAVSQPLLTLIERETITHEVAQKEYNIALETWKIRKKVCEEIYKDNYKKMLKSNSDTHSQLTLHVEEISAEPKKRRYKTEDATIEKIGELLVDNPQGLLLFRDELAGWLKSFNKMGRENDRQFYLESWSGKKDTDIDRIGRGTLHVPALCLSVFGSIQPGPLSKYVYAAIRGGIDDDGFIQRFQIMVWPDPKETWELVSGISIPDLILPIQKIFDCLDSLTFFPDGSSMFLSFTQDAQELFDQWQGEFERKIRSGTLLPHIEAHLSKYKKLLPALCLILEHLKLAVDGIHPLVITVSTLRAALQWIDYFESHAYRIYGSGANAILKAASDLINRLRQNEIEEPFTARDIYCGNHWAGLANVNEVEEVLDFLIEKGYLACKVLKTGGRPTTKYWVNPLVFEKPI